MSKRLLKKIRDAVNAGRYYLTEHAQDEMLADDFRYADIENAVRKGRLAKVETDDPRGPRYTVIGPGADREVEVGVVGRFTESGQVRVITVYEITEPEET